MKYCSDPNCPFRRRHGEPAEYRDDAEHCSDCGARLVAGDAPVARPTSKSPPVQGRLWRRLAVTLGIIVLVEGASRITLPGLNREALYDAFTYAGGSIFSLFDRISSALYQASVLALGLVPILTGYVLVELAALAVPRWRALRISGPRGRAKLERLSAFATLVLAIIQGLGVTTYVANLSAWHMDVVLYSPFQFLLLGTLTLVAGTMGLWLCARVITRHGLGNGFSVLIGWAIIPLALWFIHDSVSDLADRLTSPMGFLFLYGAMAFMVWLAYRMLCGPRRGHDPGEPSSYFRLPACGLTPVEGALSLMLLPATITSFMVLESDWLFRFLTPETRTYLAISLVLLVGMSVLFGYLFNRPKRVAAAWSQLLDKPRPQMEQHARELLRPAILASTLFLVFLLATEWLLWRVATPRTTLGILLLVVAVAVWRDLWAEWVARRNGNLISVWPIHRVYAIDPAIDLLARNGIQVLARGANHRTLLQFFGPYVPVELMVKEADAQKAYALLRAALGIEVKRG